MSQPPPPEAPAIELAARGAIGPVDRLTRGLGQFAGWMLLAMVLVGAWNAVGRFLGRFVGQTLTSNALIELQWYLFSVGARQQEDGASGRAVRARRRHRHGS